MVGGERAGNLRDRRFGRGAIAVLGLRLVGGTGAELGARCLWNLGPQ